MTQAENMTALSVRYRQECAAFNRLPALPDTDLEFKRHLNALRRTEKRIRRAPIKTKQDAFAALKFIEREIVDGADWGFLCPLFKSLHTYIEGGRS